MEWQPHYALVRAGGHAFLSASKYHWLRYSDEKMETVFFKSEAAKEGVRKHAVAHELIALGIRQTGSKAAFNRYVNAGIKYRMRCEQILVYSENSYGTADTIKFREMERHLRIHDYKSGVIPGSEDQLEIYEALFCLEYGYRPHDLDVDLAIYQGTEPREWKPNPDEILEIMEKIVKWDPIIDGWRKDMAGE